MDALNQLEPRVSFYILDMQGWEAGYLPMEAGIMDGDPLVCEKVVHALQAGSAGPLDSSYSAYLGALGLSEEASMARRSLGEYYAQRLTEIDSARRAGQLSEESVLVLLENTFLLLALERYGEDWRGFQGILMPEGLLKILIPDIESAFGNPADYFYFKCRPEDYAWISVPCRLHHIRPESEVFEEVCHAQQAFYHVPESLLAAILSNKAAMAPGLREFYRLDLFDRLLFDRVDGRHKLLMLVD